MDPLTQFGELGPPLGAVIAGITPEQLDRPTPCAEFTVRGVLEHMVGGATMFAASYRGQAPADPDLSDVLGAIGPTLEDLGAAMSAPGALDRTIAAPFGEVPGDAFARFVVLDGLVHGWDLATATGQPYDPPEELVAEVEAFARGQLDAAARRPDLRRRRRGACRRHPHRTTGGLHGPPSLRRRTTMTQTLTLDDLEAIKEKQQATWSSGDYAVIGTTLQIVGEALCEAVDVAAGWQVLDVAAGNGNASLAAARRGCEVTATDYVDSLLERARTRAAADGLSADHTPSPTPRPCPSRTRASTACSRPSA